MDARARARRVLEILEGIRARIRVGEPEDTTPRGRQPSDKLQASAAELLWLPATRACACDSECVVCSVYVLSITPHARRPPRPRSSIHLRRRP